MRGFGRYKTLDWMEARNLALELLGHSLVARKGNLSVQRVPAWRYLSTVVRIHLAVLTLDLRVSPCEAYMGGALRYRDVVARGLLALSSRDGWVIKDQNPTVCSLPFVATKDILVGLQGPTRGVCDVFTGLIPQHTLT